MTEEVGEVTFLGILVLMASALVAIVVGVVGSLILILTNYSTKYMENASNTTASVIYEVAGQGENAVPIVYATLNKNLEFVDSIKITIPGSSSTIIYDFTDGDEKPLEILLSKYRVETCTMVVTPSSRNKDLVNVEVKIK